MISSDIIKTKLIKMEELRKQTVDRIAEFFNGDSNNPKVDTYKKLLDFEKEIIKAINYSPCCTTLKTKKAPTFEYWLICNFEETQTGKYIDFNNGDTYRDKQVLKLKYNKIFKPTL